MEILRKVKCSERLPKKEGSYTVRFTHIDYDSMIYFNGIRFETAHHYKVEYWYEPITIELKSEEILPINERLDFKNSFTKIHIKNSILEDYHKALEVAELESVKYKELYEINQVELNTLQVKYKAVKEVSDRRTKLIEILEEKVEELKASKSAVRANKRHLENTVLKSFKDKIEQQSKLIGELIAENQGLKYMIEKNHGGNCIIAPKDEVDKIAKERYEKALNSKSISNCDNTWEEWEVKEALKMAVGL